MTAMVEGAPGVVPDQPGRRRRTRCTRTSEQAAQPGAGGDADMDWLAAVERLRRERRPGCWSPWPRCAATRPARPAPRWSSPPTATWGSIGGGNLEATAVDRARAMLAEATRHTRAVRRCRSTTRRRPSTAAVLRRRGAACSSSRSPSCPSVAIFGVGHVGLELARILARHDLELHLVDSRADQLGRRPARLSSTTPAAGCTSTTRPCPSSCSARCRAAPTCWS